MNEYDSSRISDVLADSHELELTTDPEEADVLLLNTCSIREKAQEKVFSQLGLKQTILVSHDPKMESFVDHILRVEKSEHESRVV